MSSAFDGRNGSKREEVREQIGDAFDSRNAFDAHAHLSFAPDPARFACALEARFAGAFSTTVSLSDYERAREVLAPFERIRIGLGVHPWWIARGEVGAQEVSRIAELATQNRFIGEVGLDFGKNGLARSVFETDEETKAAQVEALRSILATCAASDPTCAPDDRANALGRQHHLVGASKRTSDRVFSFHAVQSADVILDLLEGFGLHVGNTIIFHWFSGSSTQLQRARELGCCFSVNAAMLRTKRGREYAKAIPADLLLVETDLPEEASCDHEDAWSNYERALISAYDQLAELRGPQVVEAIAQNVSRIFA